MIGGFSIFCGSVYAQSADLSSDDVNKLKATEQKLFIRTYDDDASEARVARIEKRMFGEAESGASP